MGLPHLKDIKNSERCLSIFITDGEYFFLTETRVELVLFYTSHLEFE